MCVIVLKTSKYFDDRSKERFMLIGFTVNTDEKGHLKTQLSIE